MIKSYAYILFILTVFLSSCGNINLFPINSDKSIGEIYDEELLKREKILDESNYAELYEELNRVKKQILSSPEIKHKNNFNWALRIIKNDTNVNAFCTPGGYIYVYTGLLKFLNSTDQLAGILGHEIAHADLRHSTQQLTKTMGIRLLFFILGFDSNLFTDLAQGLINLSFSRSHETQADEFSVKYLRTTPFNPKAIIYFFKKLEQKEKQGISMQFLSTHPNPENRTENILSLCSQLDINQNNQDSLNFKKILTLLP